MKIVNELELKDLDKKLNADSKSSDSPQKKSSILEPWFLYAVGSMFAMATANYLNGVLGHLGLKILFYYNIGPLVVSSTYFLA